jgi:protein-S-isoprenylcysteine O-methyltransferase Ste14
MSTRQHLLAILFLPFSVTVIAPLFLLLLSIWSGILWLFLYPLNLWTLLLGITLVVLGLIIQYKTNRAFARFGKGTLAPWAPTQHFVAVGLYCYVRNPMILGVLLVILGEAVVFGSTLIFLWFSLFWAMNHIWFLWWEEPDLERRFSTEYQVYRQHVRRWIPRWSAWTPEEKHESSNKSAEKHP